MQNCAEISPFFGYKALVLLKKTVRIDVSTYENGSKWVYLEGS